MEEILRILFIYILAGIACYCFLAILEYIDRKKRVLESFKLILNKSDKHKNIEIFVTAILEDYDSGAIDFNQAALALKHALVLLERGDVSAAVDWMRTGRKHIRML